MNASNEERSRTTPSDDERTGNVDPGWLEELRRSARGEAEPDAPAFLDPEPPSRPRLDDLSDEGASPADRHRSEMPGLRPIITASDAPTPPRGSRRVDAGVAEPAAVRWQPSHQFGSTSRMEDAPVSSIDRPAAPKRFGRQRIMIAVMVLVVLVLSTLLFLGADDGDEAPDPTTPATDVVDDGQVDGTQVDGASQVDGADDATQDGDL